MWLVISEKTKFGSEETNHLSEHTKYLFFKKININIKRLIFDYFKFLIILYFIFMLYFHLGSILTTATTKKKINQLFYKQIMMAIDNSLSMKEKDVGYLAL